MTAAQRRYYEKLLVRYENESIGSDIGFLLNLVRQMDNAARAVTGLAEPPAPVRPRIAIIGAPDSVGATLAAMHAHPYGRELDLTGISITCSELPTLRDVQEKDRHLEVVDLLASDHHRPRPFFSTQLFGPLEYELAALNAVKKVVPIYPSEFCLLDRLGYAKELPPPPRFSGYVGKGKRRRYPPPR